MRYTAIGRARLATRGNPHAENESERTAELLTVFEWFVLRQSSRIAFLIMDRIGLLGLAKRDGYSRQWGIRI